MVDVKISSIPSAPGNIVTVPMGELTEEVFEEGFGFDGSSIRGMEILIKKRPTCSPCLTRRLPSSILSAPSLPCR